MGIVMLADVPKPLYWTGSTKKDLLALPDEVIDVFGFAFFLAQTGRKHEQAKPLQGFGGAGVLEVAEDHMGDTYRAVYTVKFPEAVYVLHCFQKRSTHGIKTSKRDIELIRTRYRAARAHAEGA